MVTLKSELFKAYEKMIPGSPSASQQYVKLLQEDGKIVWMKLNASNTVRTITSLPVKPKIIQKPIQHHTGMFKS